MEIKAFAQVLWRWPLIGILRAGEGTDAYGKPYEFAVVFRKRFFRRSAIIYALVATPPRCEECEWHTHLRRAHCAASFRVLKVRFGLEPHWERYKVRCGEG